MRRSLAALLLGLALAPAARAESLEDRRRALQAITAREDALEARLDAERHTLARLLSALVLYSRDPPPPLLVSPTDARDAVRAMILARAITPELEARARALAAEAARLRALRREAAQASGALFAQESALQDRESRLEAVSADAELLAPPSIRAQASREAQSPAPTRLLRPVDGRLSAQFGGRLEDGLRAEGIAYRTGAGAVVRSPAAGVVAYAGPINGWGQVVILRAGGGCHMVLSGLGKVTVTVGQSVAAAFPVGTMPADGQTPPELYLEVRMAGGPIDPARLMAGGRETDVNGAAPQARGQGVG